jgi:hypothetical protein
VNTHLPESLVRDLTKFATILAAGVASDAGRIDAAARSHPAFDRRAVTGPMLRALVSEHGLAAANHRVRAESLSNLGLELITHHEGIERRFRMRKASLSAHGAWQIQSNSDSILTAAARAQYAPPMLWPEVDLTVADDDFQQWVLAYLPHWPTHTITRFMAALPVGLVGERPPYRLLLEHHTIIDVEPASTLRFTGIDPGLGRDVDDLDDQGVAEGF